MIHTVYSNAYEVLRLILLHNLDAMKEEGKGLGLFDHVPLLVPTGAVATDLARAIAKRHGICAGWEFVNPGEWMGFFAKAPLANVVGNEAEWMIWRILREDGEMSFRAQKTHERLAYFLDGKNDEAIYQFARRLAALFVVYASYRADWIFRWLNVSSDILGEKEIWLAEEAALKTSPDYDWQRDLWVRLAENPRWKGLQFLENFVGNLKRLAESQEDAALTEVLLDEDRRIKLPQTLHVFMPFVLPPLMLPVFKALALSGRDIWFYMLNPSSAYWFDSASAAKIATDDAAEGEDEAEGEGGAFSSISSSNIHPLLSADAGAIRANIDRLWQFTTETDEVALLDARTAEDGAPPPEKQTTWDIARFQHMAQRLTLDADMESDRESYFIERRGETLLSRVQDSLLNNQVDEILLPNGQLKDEEDQSILFWNAPNETRQWEAVADAIETLFAKDKTLKPSDILVATPDVTAAAPLIDKVFGSIPFERRFPWRLTGVAPIATEELAEAISGLSALMNTRAARETLEAWLALPPIAKRFSLTTEELTLLGEWLAAAGYREGLSEEHLRAWDPQVFSFDAEMNLLSAIERLTLGYALPDDEGLPLAGVLPRHGDEFGAYRNVHERADLLETLQSIALTLEDFRQETLVERPAAYWAQWLMRAIHAFFASPEEMSGVKAVLKELLRELSLAGETDEERGEGITLSFALFMHALLGKLEVSAGRPGPSAEVTISSMEALRGLPYRVVFIVGLDADCGFPGTMQREEFDLMRFAPRRGDRDSRRDRRSLFLDWILAARDRLIVTYVTSSKLAEAEVMQPSVVVQELRDWLLSLVPEEERREEEARRLTELLPLNTYSLENFLPSQALWLSHDKEALRARRDVEEGKMGSSRITVIASALPPVQGAEPGWSITDAKNPPIELPLSVLASFVKAPEKWIANAASFFPPPDPTSREESVWPQITGLEGWQKKSNFLEDLKAQESINSIAKRRAEDPTAGAREARVWLEKSTFALAIEARERFESDTQGWSALPEESHRLSLFGGRVILTGTLKALYKGTLSEGENNEHTGRILTTLSASSHYGQTMALSWVFANALAQKEDEAVGFYGVMLKKDNNHKLPYVETLSALPPPSGLCRELLEDAIEVFLTACATPTDVIAEEKDNQGFALLFGGDMKSKRYSTSKRLEAGQNLMVPFEEERFRALWRVWWSVVKTQNGGIQTGGEA